MVSTGVFAMRKRNAPSTPVSASINYLQPGFLPVSGQLEASFSCTDQVRGRSEPGSATAAIRGGWPVCSRNRTRSARAIEVVIVLTSG